MDEKYIQLRDTALRDLQSYMDSLDEKKGKILAYWVHDYTRFLKKEADFDPRDLIRYKRGSIVKAHLGYRIGSEEGGLHYAVVMDTDNAKSSHTVTIIPLTSAKSTSKPHPSKVPLGNELYTRLETKIGTIVNDTEKASAHLNKRIIDLSTALNTPDADHAALTQERRVLMSGIEDLNRKISMLKKMNREISKMKTGSIALVSQITTISKIRIYDPMYPFDTLSGIRLSNDSMDKLDEKVKELFTKN